MPKFVILTSKFKNFIESIPSNRLYTSEETYHEVAENVLEFANSDALDEYSQDLIIRLRTIRNSVVKHFDEKRDEEIDRGRLLEDDWNKMMSITSVIDNLIYELGGAL